MENKFIPLSRPNISEEDIDQVSEVLRSGMLVQGEKVKAFETAFAEYIGCKHAIAVSNGTASLHLALKALNIGPGDEVIIPAFSYVATANVVELVGAKPVFIDVSLDTCNIEVGKVEEIKSKHVKALMPVHEFGLAANIHEITEISKQRDWHLIEDAACALGATEKAKHVGTFKDFGSFSFHPRKAITSGEGGLVTTNDDTLARRIAVLRNHGISSEGQLEFVDAGFNYRLTEIQAALLIGQLSRFSKTLSRRRFLAGLYYQRLSGCDLLKLPVIPPEKEHTWQTFHILLAAKIDRARVIMELKNKGIGTNYGAQCIPAVTFYQKKYSHDSQTSYPNAWALYTRGLALPMYEALTEEEIHYICDSILHILKEVEKT